MPRKKKLTKKEAELQEILSHYESNPVKFNPELFKGVVGEHLRSFIIIGYTQTGEPVTITAAESQQETDALSTSMQRFIQNFFGHAPPETQDTASPDD